MTTWFRQPASRFRRDAPPSPAEWAPVVEWGSAGRAPEVGHRVRLFTADELLVGTVHGEGRLSDILNLRGQVHVEDLSIAPLNASRTDARACASVDLDPFDIDLAMANALPDAPWTRARRIHKVRYPVRIDAGGYAIEGVMHVFPGGDPTDPAQLSGSLFFPVTEARVHRAGRLVSDPTVDAVLVNRHLVRTIVQADIEQVQDSGALLLRRRELAVA